MRLNFWKREPLRCFSHEGYLSFSRTLTADELTLFQFAWASGYGLSHPLIPARPLDRRTVQDVSGMVYQREDG